MGQADQVAPTQLRSQAGAEQRRCSPPTTAARAPVTVTTPTKAGFHWLKGIYALQRTSPVMIAIVKDPTAQKEMTSSLVGRTSRR